MRKSVSTLALVVAMGMVLVPFAAWAQMGPGYGYGYGMGPGMMGSGWYGPQYGSQDQQQKPLGKEEAKQEVENYLKSTRNPNLKLGTVTDKGSYFEADVVTKNDSPVDKILVNKNTGWMQSAY
jgi:hypothetical protein